MKHRAIALIVAMLCSGCSGPLVDHCPSCPLFPPPAPPLDTLAPETYQPPVLVAPQQTNLSIQPVSILPP